MRFRYNDGMIDSEAEPLPNPEASSAELPVKSGKGIRPEYFVAGLIILLIAGFAGRNYVKGLFTSDSTNPAAARHIEAGVRA